MVTGGRGQSREDLTHSIVERVGEVLKSCRVRGDGLVWTYSESSKELVELDESDSGSSYLPPMVRGEVRGEE